MWVIIMIIEYRITGTYKIIENKTFRSYGISCYINNDLYKCIDDITLNNYEAVYLCEKLNKLKISPVHFPDIVEDFLEK
jgi:hypothetical protein